MPALRQARVSLQGTSALVSAHCPPNADEAQIRDEAILLALQQGVAGDFAGLEQILCDVGTRWARASIDLDQWYDVAELMHGKMLPALLDTYANDRRSLELSLRALQRLVDSATRVITREYLRARERQLSEQRKHTDEALLRYARLAEAGIIGIFVCDIHGQAKEANQCFLDMLGYTREELLRSNWVELTPPEWRHLDDAAVQQLQASGVTRPWEKEYVRKDGSRVAILVGVAMLNQTDCIAFVLDITERKRVEALRARSDELENQNIRIREANRLKSEFLANMSHELRTPLNSIIGFADLLYDGEVAPGSPHYKDALGDILKSGRHLLQLINDVLDLAKVESGKMEFRPEPVQLTQIVAEVCAVLRTLAAEKQIRLEYSLDPTVNELTLDPARLKQVLYNYVSNALKFTPAQGTVLIRTQRESEAAFRLEVVDNGIGIAVHDLDRLFLEFNQLDAGNAKKHAGTGLGLALTKRVVEAQGGEVGAHSELGKGSVFFALLPCDMALASQPLENLIASTSSAGAAILVVDDDQRDRNIIIQMLASAGYNVESAATGMGALARCASKAFDAITLDLLLPDLSGLEVLHKLRSEGVNQQTPVIVVSVVAERGVVGGFPVHDYLRKPVRGGELLASLGHAGVLPKTEGVVLVVDDDASSLKLMNVTLTNLGYDVVCTEDGEAALAAAAHERPLAVILDLLMPNVDGFEFLARFRSVPSNRGVPVIVWTVKDLTALDRRRLNELAQGVFTKGDGRPSELLEELQTLLMTGRQSFASAPEGALRPRVGE